MQEFKLPDLGEGMHEAEVVQWLIKPGDTIKLDQTMVHVKKDKAIVKCPAPVAGRVAEIRGREGRVARVGEVLVILDPPDDARGGGSTPAKNSRPGVVAPDQVHPPSPADKNPPAKQRVLA